MTYIDGFYKEADLYIVNFQFAMLFIVIVVLLAFLFFSIGYYYYIERLKAVLYMIGYIIALMVNQFAYAFYSISTSSQGDAFWKSIMNVSKVTAIYILFSCCIVLFRKKYYTVRLIGSGLYVLSLGLLTLPMIERYVEFGYAIVSIMLIAFLLYATYKKKGSIRKLLIRGVFGYMAYTLLELWIVSGIHYKLTIDWLIIEGVIVIFLFYFLRRCKLILREKTELYDKLIKDELTGVYARGYFLEALEEKHTGYLLFLDINKFKGVNDRFGHRKGDELLQIVGHILKMYEGHGQIPARIGGDEFILYLPSEEEEYAVKVAKEFVKEFARRAKSYHFKGVEGLGLSIGISKVDVSSNFILYNRADEAMYQAKKNGNNQIVVYNQETRSW